MAEVVTSGAPPSQDTSLPLLRAHPLLGREENMKLLFDDVMSDISHDRKTSIRISEREQLQSLRHTTNANTVDHMLNVAATLSLITATQTGETTDQTASGPEHTAEGAEDTGNAAVGTANAQVAANIASLASALVPIVVGTSAAALTTTQLATAVLAAITAASGSAAASAKG